MTTGLMYTGSADFAHVGLIFQLDLASNKASMVLHYFSLSFLEATSSTRSILLCQGSTGSGGTAVTEHPLQTRNTTPALAELQVRVTTTGTITRRFQAWEWNRTRLLEYEPAPKDRHTISPSDPQGSRFQLRNTLGLGTVSVTVVWEEF